MYVAVWDFSWRLLELEKLMFLGRMFQSSWLWSSGKGCPEGVATLSGTLWLEDSKAVILLSLPVLGCHVAADSSELTVLTPSLLPISFQGRIGTFQSLSFNITSRYSGMFWSYHQSLSKSCLQVSLSSLPDMKEHYLSIFLLEHYPRGEAGPRPRLSKVLRMTDYGLTVWECSFSLGCWNFWKDEGQ